MEEEIDISDEVTVKLIKQNKRKFLDLINKRLKKKISKRGRHRF